MDELSKLKKQAKELYIKANDFGDLSCGRTLAENFRPQIGIARREFNRIWERIKTIDPSAPDNPLK